ncbi:glycoprotein-N-acetylgalactosamine 3-beta-galactosyltransferase 1 isoform X3 [Folsomia candida]|uniref:glycoprotein-N-acetylgalactosamine 3-beta-galactosyltransferase 1 isoform X3 n=1 Tax=Folsomia candida TaxID=158441 RepID=UPI0016054EAB|nr:glycoprotein-N-acetylgalactosamine 3-beta-galactosyltransferase 1 isoform X3 [Folsomia candida]
MMKFKFTPKYGLAHLLIGFGIGILSSHLYNTLGSHNADIIGQHNFDIGPAPIVHAHEVQITPKRLLCWVLTSPRTHERRAKYVKQTWGKRCHILIFISTKYDPTLPTVPLNMTEGRINLWGKTRDAFTHVYNHYLESADFFLKADDDTYVIVENLLHLLQPYDPNETLYLGCEFKGYMSGGAGYVLSKATVKLLVEKGLSNPKICKQGNDGIEDVELVTGACLRNLNVTLGDSRDESGKHRFFPLRVIDHINPGRITKFRYDWFWEYMKFRPEDGPNGCSAYPISFHYIEGQELVAMDHLIYKVQVYPVHI